MVLKRKLQTSKQYDAISCPPQGENFVVTSLAERCVDVITLDGDVIKTFAPDPKMPPEMTFDSPRYVFYTKDNTYVIR